VTLFKWECELDDYDTSSEEEKSDVEDEEDKEEDIEEDANEEDEDEDDHELEDATFVPRRSRRDLVQSKKREGLTIFWRRAVAGQRTFLA